ncbi:transcriptional regulator [Thalassotalea insulae]|uniref:Transcriptional regulator n=1 Tax=Thalassotalea insulae TaxID=2056778 RepID=A0ABQ6GXU7_9GAMM|nr:metalloregulator ArsR/SmtB family transcription factor [Thalassotalea insulae]GLX79580.1 transcriptional regulator [Thalassotalea insulae]
MTLQREADSPDFFQCLAEPTRLLILMLLTQEQELCVCELTQGLALSQPKISRHLALLRTKGLLSCRKSGKWVFYQLAPQLPLWQQQIIELAQSNNQLSCEHALARMNQMAGRPEKAASCCNN